MSIVRKVRAVEKLYGELQQAISQFQSATELQCVAGCGFCCQKPDIEATALEFLPFAYQLYIDGKAYEWLEQMEHRQQDKFCSLFHPLHVNQQKGMCSEYAYRGLVCRLFGFSATMNKYGQPILSTCKIIKTGQATQYEKAKEAITEGLPVPVMRHYYSRLCAIDHRLTEKLYPINQAILYAIETVLAYYAYRGKKVS
jgi:uncharacterized protein